MSDRESTRRAAQLAFVESGQELSVGNPEDCPLPPAALLALTQASAGVVAAFGGGLTAEVLCLEHEGRRYNIKRKRPTALVANVDGQTSFLTEVQRRADFARLKADPRQAGAFSHIVDTCYASFRQGLIVSPWIEGTTVNTFNERILGQILSTIANMELAGLFEWDFCPGNILDDGHSIRLFDFGYCWPFNPLTEYNSNGLRDPLFHGIERFETRNLFGHLLQLETTTGSASALALFRLHKALAVETYTIKLAELERRGASGAVLGWHRQLLSHWQLALQSASGLADLYLVEGYRSHLLDLHDDLSGKSCTAMTLRRADAVHETLSHHFDLLVHMNGLFFGDEQRSQQELLAINRQQRQQAEQYQL